MGMPVIPPKTKGEAIQDLLESIALEETALAAIMNAEGSKIQKVLRMNDVTPAKIALVNRSVESMLKVIAKKEMLLQFKLESVAGIR